jgi:biopolymer transport protein ExbD
MSRSRNLKQKEENTEINISPMIDMVFILLIFFIVTTVFVDEVGIGVDKPQPAPPDQQNEDPKEPVVFKIMANGQVLHKEDQVTMAQVQSIVEETLSRDDVPVILQVQRNALAGLMVQVIDYARLANADKISVTSID